MVDCGVFFINYDNLFLSRAQYAIIAAMKQPAIAICASQVSDIRVRVAIHQSTKQQSLGIIQISTFAKELLYALSANH